MSILARLLAGFIADSRVSALGHGALPTPRRRPHEEDSFGAARVALTILAEPAQITAFCPATHPAARSWSGPLPRTSPGKGRTASVNLGQEWYRSRPRARNPATGNSNPGEGVGKMGREWWHVGCIVAPMRAAG